MKRYTTADVDKSGTYARVVVDKADFVDTRPAWMRRGLQQTASGYGRKLNTGRSFWFNGKLRRVYACQISNAGTCYIVGGGNWNGNLIVDSF